MRSLNKIVFINSAHVRYAEIGLNGNVHLIGTQGVGKVPCCGRFFSSIMEISKNWGFPKKRNLLMIFTLNNPILISYMRWNVMSRRSACW